MSSRWEVHSEKPLYTDEWLDIRLADVELPDGRRLDHRLIRTRPGAGVAMIVDGSVLLLWRHRFITGTWGWEVPLGKADPGEDPPAGPPARPRRKPAGVLARCALSCALSRPPASPTRSTMSSAPIRHAHRSAA